MVLSGACVLLLVAAASMSLALTAVQIQPFNQAPAELTYRVVSLATDGGTVANGGTGTTFSTGAVTVTVNDANSDSLSSAVSKGYQKLKLQDVATGNAASQAIFKFLYPPAVGITPLVQLTQCSTSLSSSAVTRKTVVFQQISSVVSGSTQTCTISNSPGSPFQGQSCPVTIGAGVSKSFTCNIIDESIETTPQCSTVQINFRRFNDAPACPGRIKLLPSDTVTDTYLDQLFRTDVTQTLLRNGNYAFESLDSSSQFVQAALTDLADARAYEITVSPSGTVGINHVESGFFKVLNAAHRETTAVSPQSEGVDFSVQSASGAVLVFEQVGAGQITPSTAANAFYELPYGTYQVKFYAAGNDRSNIFGTATQPLGVSNAQIATQTLVIDASNKYQVVILSSSGAPYTGATARTLNLTPPASPAQGTTFVVHNEVQTGGAALPLGFLNQNADSCTRLTPTGGLLGGSATLSLNTLTTVLNANNRQLKIVDSASTCDSCNTPYATYSVPIGVGSNDCAIKHLFFLGRTFQTTENVALGTCPTPINGQQGAVTCQSRTTPVRVGDLQFRYEGNDVKPVLNGDGIPSSSNLLSTPIEIDVPLCTCVVPTSQCTATPCELLTAINSIASSASSAIGNAIAPLGGLSGQIGSVVAQVEEVRRVAVQGRELTRTTAAATSKTLKKILNKVD